MPTVEVIAATYFDDRGRDGKEGVILFYPQPSQDSRGWVVAPVETWHDLALKTTGGHCYVKLGDSIFNPPPNNEDPDEIFAGHDFAVHLKLVPPVEMVVP